MANIALTARDERFIAAMRQSAGAVGELSAKININLRNAFKAGDYAARQFSQGIGKVGERLRNVGSNMTSWFTVPMSLASAGILKTYGDLEQLQIGLRKYEVTLRDIKTLAKVPGLGFEEAGKSLQMLAGARYDVELSKRAIMEFGNALADAGGGKEDLIGIFRAFAQIKGKPGVMAQEINQIAERLPAIRSMMTDVFGTADTESLQKMGLGADEFMARLVEYLSKMPRVASGFKNAMGNIGDSLKYFAFRVGEAMNNAFNLEAMAERIGNALDGLAEWFAGLDPAIQKTIFVIGGVVMVMGPLLALVGGITAAIPVLTGAFLTLSSLITPVVVAIGGLAALVMMHWERVSPFFSDMADSIGFILGELWSVVRFLWGKMTGFIHGSTGGVLATVVELFSNALRIVAEGVRLFSGVIQGDWNAVGTALLNIWKTLWNSIISLTQGAIRLVGDGLGSLFELFGWNNWADKLNAITDGMDVWIETNLKVKIAKIKALSYELAQAQASMASLDFSFNPSAPSAGGANPFMSSSIKGYDVNSLKGLIDVDNAGKVLTEHLNGIKVEFNGPKVMGSMFDFLKSMEDQIATYLKTLGMDFIGDAFEGLFSGKGIQGAVKNLLKSLGSAIMQIGRQFLVANKAIEGLKKTLGGTLGIGASIAAIALGGLIKGIGNNMQMPKLAIGTNMVHSDGLAFLHRGEQVMPAADVMRGGYRNIGTANAGGGIENMTFRISGQDLLLVMERAKRNM